MSPGRNLEHSKINWKKQTLSAPPPPTRAEMIFCLNWIELNALYPLVWFFPLCPAAIVFNHPNESSDVTMTNFWLVFSFRCSDSESSPPKKFLLFLSFWYHEDHSHTVFWDFGVWVAVFEHSRNQLLFFHCFHRFLRPIHHSFPVLLFQRLPTDFPWIVSVIGKKIQEKNDEGPYFWALFQAK